jgi:hypothetical protein
MKAPQNWRGRRDQEFYFTSAMAVALILMLFVAGVGVGLISYGFLQ